MAIAARISISKKILLALPVLLTLAFFLFHVESIGMASHVVRKSHFEGSQFRVDVPRHWIVQYAGDDREVEFWAVAVKGFVRRSADPNLRWGALPIAHIEGHSYAARTALPEVNEQPECRFGRQMKIASVSGKSIVNGRAECIEYRYVRCGSAEIFASVTDRYVWAACAAGTRISSLRLSFVGAPEMLPEFYSFLQTHVALKQQTAEGNP